MYQIAHIDPAQLTSVKVPNQDRIEEATGQRLDVSQAYNFLKTQSNNFKKQDGELLKVDKLFGDLLRLQGIDLPEHSERTPTEGDGNSKEAEAEKIRIRARAREREAEALELEMQLLMINTPNSKNNGSDQ